MFDTFKNYQGRFQTYVCRKAREICEAPSRKGSIRKVSEIRTLQVKCSKNFMCECNRRNCPGKIYSISYYTRKILEA